MEWKGAGLVTESAAAYILLDYPTLWGSWQEQRQTIVDAYSGDHGYQGGGGSHSDETFKKTARLIELDGDENILKVVEQWITAGLAAQDRILLISVWRRVPSAEIERRYLGQGETIAERWQRMVKGMIRFAGTALGEHGRVSASIQTSSRPVL